MYGYRGRKNSVCIIKDLVLKKIMLKKFFLPLLFAAFLLPAGLASAFETKGQDCLKCHTLSKDEAKDLLKDFYLDLKVLDVRLSPIKAFWEIFLDSRGQKGIVYIDFSKKHFVFGSIISIKEKKNLSQERLTDLTRVDVSQIPVGDALVMGDQNAKIRVIVFDDPD
jgi:thiol:disulfide interchange protein DsbC